MKSESAQTTGYLLALLAETPGRLQAAADGRTEEELRGPMLRCATSPVLTLAHLRSCETVWTPTIRRMLAEDNPRFTCVHPWQFIKKSGFTEQDFASALAAFTERRRELLALLEPLPPEGWERTATIDRREHSVYSQVRKMALHESGHCAELEEAGFLPKKRLH